MRASIAVVAALAAGVASGLRSVEEADPMQLNMTALLQKRVEEDAEGQRDLDLLCDKLGDLIDCAEQQPIRLGDGSYSVAWYVKLQGTPADSDDDAAVIKLYHNQKYMNGDKKANKFLTLADLKNAKKDERELLEEADNECNYAEFLHKVVPAKAGSDAAETAAAAEAAKAHNQHPGREHLMKCFGTNIDFNSSFAESDLDEPIWSLLEYTGKSELNVFMDTMVRTTPDASGVLRKLMMDVLESLEYMTSFSPPVVHHDLKPSNIMVGIYPDAGNITFYTAKLIDYGGMHFGDKEGICNARLSTDYYAPAEWSMKDPRAPKRQCPNGKVYMSPTFPENFDVYSASIIFIELISGNEGVVVLQGVHEDWCRFLEERKCVGTFKGRPGQFMSRFERVMAWWRGETDEYSNVPGETVGDPYGYQFTQAGCEREYKMCQKQAVIYNQDGSTEMGDHFVVEHAVSRFDFFVESLRKSLKKYAKDFDGEWGQYNLLMSLIRDKQALSFLELVTRGLYYYAEERPSSEEFLKHPWMVAAAAQEQEEIAAADAAAAAEEAAAAEAEDQNDEEDDESAEEEQDDEGAEEAAEERRTQELRRWSGTWLHDVYDSSDTE